MHRTVLSLAVPLALVTALAGCTSPMSASSPRERSGLGTTWGETRRSEVRLISFERDDASGPQDVATLYYDDVAGVRALTGGASVRDRPDEAVELAGGALWVRVLDADGDPLPIFSRAGRRHVEGRDGERYTIEIANRSGNRVEAVATVDGLDVMNGRPGTFDNRGYVLGPWSSFRIDGFRKSLEQVAAFRFGSVADSYAAQKGDASNVGVIGVAFFAERGVRRDMFDREAERRRGADPFPGAFADPP
jgi:hypothetical protein